MLIGDSFVAGDAIEAPHRFTSLMQDDFDSASPERRVRIVNLGYTWSSTMIYDRLYRDVVRSLDPDIVIVCLDQTDAADDYLYERELSAPPGAGRSEVSDADFADTVLQHFESHPARFALLRYSRVVLGVNALPGGPWSVASCPTRRAWLSGMRRSFGSTTRRAATRSRTRISLHARRTTFGRSWRCGPPHQQLYFVTYPRAENLAGQQNDPAQRAASRQSCVGAVLEHWIARERIAERYRDATFVHTSRRLPPRDRGDRPAVLPFATTSTGLRPATDSLRTS